MTARALIVVLGAIVGGAAAAADAPPIATMSDETRTLLRADWAAFTPLPGTFQSFRNGHGMFVFHGRLKSPLARPNGRAATVDGIVFLQYPTRRVALSFARLLDAEQRELSVERTDDPRFHQAAPGGPLDLTLERFCADPSAAGDARDLGYRPQPPTITITAWRDVTIGEPLAGKLPACLELTPKRHAELVKMADARCQHADPARPETAVTVYAPNPKSEDAWHQHAIVVLREGKVAAVYEFLAPEETNSLLEMAVRSFGLPTIVRSTESSAGPGLYKREFYWVGETQVVALTHIDRLHAAGGLYGVAGYLTREQYELTRAQPPQ